MRPRYHVLVSLCLVTHFFWDEKYYEAKGNLFPIPRFVTFMHNLPVVEASASNGLELKNPKLRFLSKTFVNL